MPSIKAQIKPLLMHRAVRIVLAYLNCHAHVYSVVVVFTLVHQLMPGSDLLVYL